MYFPVENDQLYMSSSESSSSGSSGSSGSGSEYSSISDDWRVSYRPTIMLIGRKYEIVAVLGPSAAFRHINVYCGSHFITREYVLLKIEKKPEGQRDDQWHPKMSFELGVLEDMKDCEGFTKILWTGIFQNHIISVRPMLHNEVLELFNRSCNRQFSRKTISMLAVQILKRLESLHSRNYVHREIKPENFRVGVEDGETNMIYLVGLEKAVKLSANSEPTVGHRVDFTLRYLSINAHRGLEQSQRDDLESLGYVLVYFFRGGRLPWTGIAIQDRAALNDEILRTKSIISVEELCQGCDPVLKTYFLYVKNLKFKEVPNYDFLRSLFTTILPEGEIDGEFDWDEIERIRGMPDGGREAERREMSSSVVDEPQSLLNNPTNAPSETSVETERISSNENMDEDGNSNVFSNTVDETEAISPNENVSGQGNTIVLFNTLDETRVLFPNENVYEDGNKIVFSNVLDEYDRLNSIMSNAMF